MTLIERFRGWWRLHVKDVRPACLSENRSLVPIRMCVVCRGAVILDQKTWWDGKWRWFCYNSDRELYWRRYEVYISKYVP